jgi:hypothetical protein
MSDLARLPTSSAGSAETIELVCPNGHRTIHSLARVLRLNDAWCGRCGADIDYKPSPDADSSAAAPAMHLVGEVPDAPVEDPPKV